VDPNAAGRTTAGSVMAAVQDITPARKIMK